MSDEHEHDETTIVDGPQSDQEIQEAVRRGDPIIPEEHYEDESEDPDEPLEHGHGDEADDDAAPVLEATSVFVVVIDRSGDAYAMNSIGSVSIDFQGQEVYVVPDRKANQAAMWRAVTEVAKDIETYEQASAVVVAQERRYREMQAAVARQESGPEQ